LQPNVIELVPPGKPLSTNKNENLPTAPAPSDSPITCGYFIAIREDGSLIFEVVGTKPGLIELLGLNSLAHEKIDTKTDRELGGKISIIVNKLDELLGHLKG